MPRVRALLLFLVVVCPLASRAAIVQERPVSIARMGVASSAVRDSTVAAFNGERFLVTWRSWERGAQAMFLDAAGQPLWDTALGLPFMDTRAVFWHQDAWSVVGSSNDGLLAAVRLDAEGKLLDGQTPLSLGTDGPFTVAVWTGEALIVVGISHVNSSANGGPIHATVFDGELRRRSSYLLGRAALGSIRVASDGASALVTFRTENWDDESLQTALFSRDGRLLRQGSGTIARRVHALGGRPDGGGYIAVAQTKDARLSTFRIDHLLVAKPVSAPFGSAKGGSGPTLAWDGSAFTLVYWTIPLRAEFHIARLLLDGTLVEDEHVGSTDNSAFFSAEGDVVAGAGISLLLYLQREEGVEGRPHATLRVRAGGNAAALREAEEVSLQRGAFEQFAPVAASSADQTLIAWLERDGPSGPLRIYAARVSHGTVLDPQSLLLGTAPSASTPLRIASDGRGFLVAWPDAKGMAAVHVGADGTVGARPTIPLVGNEPLVSFSLVSNGTDYLLVWAQRLASGAITHAVRVRADGSVIDTVPIHVATTPKSGLAAASNGQDYFVVMSDRAVRLTAAGTIDMRTYLPGRFIPSLLWWNGTSYAGVLYPWDDSTGPWSVHITPGGTILTSPLPPLLAFDQWGFSKTYDGLCGASGCTDVFGAVEEGRYVLYERRTNGDGTWTRGRTVEIAPVLRLDRHALNAITAFRQPGGRLYAAFERNAPQMPYAGIKRIFIVPMDPSRTRAVRH
ncbi:MAG TPA: hypothetical protein VE010_07935 [Thermoanaerobaculia bacterium]|nr:hypothetical protein [Thermoanaerobaculia bacterium]